MYQGESVRSNQTMKAGSQNNVLKDAKHAVEMRGNCRVAICVLCDQNCIFFKCNHGLTEQ